MKKLSSAIPIIVCVLLLPLIVHAQCVQPPTSMVSWWPGDGNAYDYAGGNNGVLIGGTTFSAGMVSQAFSFDGSDDYVFVLNTTNIDGGSQATYDAWVFPESAPAVDNYYGIVGAGDSTQPVWTTQQCRLLYWRTESSPTNSAKFYIDCGTSDFEPSYIGRLTAHDYPINNWYSVAGVFNDGTLDIYVNGVLDNGTLNSLNAGTSINNNANNYVWIGAAVRVDQSFQSVHFDGLIDEVEIFNRALTAEEISNIYNAGSDGKCKKPFFSCIPADGNPPSIDGTISANEWPSFAQLVLNTPVYPIQTEVYCMNDSINLYILVDAIGDTSDDDISTPCTAVNYSHCDECLLVFGDQDQTTNYLAEVWGLAGNIIGTNTSFPANAQVAIGFNGNRFYEWKIPLASINALPGQTIDFSSPRLCKGIGNEETCLSMPYDGATSLDNEWPLGVDPNSRTRWSQMQLAHNIVNVPTLTQWGIIIFIVLAGLGAAYYLRRQRRSEI